MLLHNRLPIIPSRSAALPAVAVMTTFDLVATHHGSLAYKTKVFSLGTPSELQKFIKE